MKILLLGGTGTLSSEVLKLSQEKGYSVYILNRGNNNTSINKNVKVYIADLNCKEKVKSVLQKEKFDVIVDFFSRTKEDIINLFPIFSNRCKQYIFISSACVYCRDNENKTPITENTAKPNRLWDYNIHKFEAEQSLIQLSNNSESYYTIVRPYITYDKKRIPLGITPAYKFHRTIIERIKNGKPMFVWNNGETYCTLTYSSDFAEALVGLFLNPKAKNEDFHITSDYCYKWKEVLTTLYEEMHQVPQIINVPIKTITDLLPEYKGELIGDRSLNAIFNNQKIKNAVPELQFKVSLREGIRKVISFYETSNDFYYDYKYDARTDKLLSQVTKKHIKYIKYPHSNRNSKITYLLHRYLPQKIANRLNLIITQIRK